ncbi:ameloblastin isoform 2 precursor [Mus musculus]|uniref:Ameloblastin n=1 Tax=Mus musculus TaxID=10090 RepID=AMBN_MOUSE|nr:ameloblastin isoform 2 precursor [Mus musculus]O55189.1 RecName: Full=Ameloblastin; Flags: Precursor [Mus musculus]AAB93765.1 ameloblastin [Mus musculus]EDL05361.1 ameloblastin, isoform CRA_a [Mus musculus]|eukprot:NP_033794.1 ameloblastin isoform 2 precursor [Mus musculus]
MSASKIPLFKMKGLILFLSLVKMSLAVPAFPQQPGAQGMAPPGMASLSLETMRQLGSLQGLNALSQYSRLGFGKALNSLWLHGLLPPHNSFPWIGPREHETQQPSLQPHQPGLKPFLQPTAATGVQVTPQKPGPQPPMHPGQLPLQEGELIAPDEPQVAPSENPPTPEVPIMDFADPQFPTVFQIARSISRGPMAHNKASAFYPGMFYMSYGANQLNAPARIGFMSSEEMPGERGSPMAYGTLFPRFGGFRQTLRRLNQNSPKGGDFTVEVDSPVSVTKGPEKGEGPEGSPLQEANPGKRENPALLSQMAPGAHAGLLAFPNDHIPSMARGPAGQRLLGVTPAAADPLITPELAEVYETYGADVTTPLGDGEATMDITMSPDTQQPLLPGNKVHQPQVHNAWRFQEP